MYTFWSTLKTFQCVRLNNIFLDQIFRDDILQEPLISKKLKRKLSFLEKVFFIKDGYNFVKFYSKFGNIIWSVRGLDMHMIRLA